MKTLIVVNNPQEWSLKLDGVEVVSARTYVMDAAYARLKDVKVYNMCKSYRYQTIGYYVSLLATARNHRPMPDVMTIQDLKSQTLVKFASEDLDQMIQKSLKPLESGRYILDIYFGKSVDKKLDRVAAQFFNLFPSPFLRAVFTCTDKWTLTSLNSLAASEIVPEHKVFAVKAAEEYFSKPKRIVRKKSARYDLAILYDPKEGHGPSNEKAMQKFVKAAESVGFYAELISKDDMSRLAEFDALFIRQTTSVNHFTYRFARRAEANGMVVIDDPQSILRCTNKVYLAELMDKNKVPIPKTMVVHKGNLDQIADTMGFPCVLKQPDSAFSLGVKKVSSQEELEKTCEVLLSKSELLIAQEFLPTEFDWRVGVLDGQPLYVCKYFMVKKHWQIIQSEGGKTRYGDFETIPVEHAPTKLIKVAVKAANLIGDGLYGVDIKQIGREYYLIEVNDNPSIDAGVEDQYLKDELYRRVMRVFLKRVEENSYGHYA